MNFSEAKQKMQEGAIVRRESWPTGTVLVQQGGYKAPLEKWSDRSPLTRQALTSLGVTETLEIKPHLDLVHSSGTMEVGYQPDVDDTRATDWTEYQYEQAQPESGGENTGGDEGNRSTPSATAETETGSVNAGSTDVASTGENTGSGGTATGPGPDHASSTDSEGGEEKKQPASDQL